MHCRAAFPKSVLEAVGISALKRPAESEGVSQEPPVLRRGRGRKCRLQFSLPRRYACVNRRIPLLGPRFAATSCRASHAYPCLFLLDTDTGNCRKTHPAITHPPATPTFTKCGGVSQVLHPASATFPDARRPKFLRRTLRQPARQNVVESCRSSAASVLPALDRV